MNLRLLPLALALVYGATFGAGALEPSPIHATEEAVAGAVQWLEARTQGDGCIGAEPAGPCGHASTREAVLALSAAGVDPNQPIAGNDSPVAYLEQSMAQMEDEPGACAACRWAKMVVVASAAGKDARAFGGVDVVARLDEHFDGVQVGSPAQINDDVWALLAWASIEDPAQSHIDAVRLHVLGHRHDPGDGGWSWTLSSQSDAWTTATTVLALLATGSSPAAEEVKEAVEFLNSKQLTSGLIDQDGAESAESTALTIQALVAAHVDPLSPDWTKPGGNLLDALVSLQGEDGSYAHNEAGGNRFIATTQALPALRFVPFPYQPPTLVLVAEPREGTLETEFSFAVHVSDTNGQGHEAIWWLDGERIAEGDAWTWTTPTRGEHRVFVDVTDGQNVWRRQEVTVDVFNAIPRVEAKWPTDVVVGTAATFSVMTAYDADGGIEIHWKFGDGKTGRGPSALHTYAQSGTYEARVRVVDNEGAMVEQPGRIHVSPAPLGAPTQGQGLPLGQTPADPATVPLWSGHVALATCLTAALWLRRATERSR